MTDPRIHGPIGEAYAAYDSDPRVSGPDDFDAFADAVEGYGKIAQIRLLKIMAANAIRNDLEFTWDEENKRSIESGETWFASLAQCIEDGDESL